MKSYFKFLSRNKAYTAIDVAGLAISIMSEVLIGCYIWQENHIDSQHSKAERLYYVGLDQNGVKIISSHWHLQFLLKDKFPEIESSTALFRHRHWMDYEGKQIETSCYFVDSTFYDIFDFKLEQGDPKTIFDDPTNIVVTREYARKVWGNEDPIGKSILFHYTERPLTVAGVMKPMTCTALMTQENNPIDMLLNFKMAKHVNPSLVDSRMGSTGSVDVVLLAKEGHDLTQRKKDYEEAVKKDLWILNLPEDNIHLEIYPFKESYFSEAESANRNFGDIKLAGLLLAVGTVILLFTIINYINLTVALIGQRAKEMATRRLLGESRMRIICRLIYESTILCTASMIGGIWLAFLMQPYASVLLRTHIDIMGCLNTTTASFLVCILIVMSFTSGIIPAIMLSSIKPIEVVNGDFRGKSNMIFGKLFIVIQNVTTITMIACSLTMYLQVRYLINAPLGYNPDGIITLIYHYSEHVEDDLLFKNELLKLNCVDNVSFSKGEPVSKGKNITWNVDGKTLSFQTFTADSIFMDILGIKLKKDNHLKSYTKPYLNTQALEELCIDKDSTHFFINGGSNNIAGVVEDFKIGNILTPQPPVIIYESNPFEHFYPSTILIKVNVDEHLALRQIRELFEKIYSDKMSDFAFYDPFMRHRLERYFGSQKQLAKIITLFACIAVIISMLGLIAISSYYIRQRAMDIAVHKVMGGTSIEVLSKIVMSFMIYVLIAALVSIPIIRHIMSDWLSQFSYRINLYWWIYAVAALLALAICVVSVVSMCIKAANANPTKSLK